MENSQEDETELTTEEQQQLDNAKSACTLFAILIFVFALLVVFNSEE